MTRRLRNLIITAAVIAALWSVTDGPGRSDRPDRITTPAVHTPVGTPADTSIEEAATIMGDRALRAVDDTFRSIAEWSEHLAELARVVEAPVVAPALPAAGDGECVNPVVPESVARRESGCRWDAYNPTGCGGRSCLGFYQLDAGHFAAVSPWNPNVSGSCYGLDPSTREGQTECASRLGPGAWG